MLVVSFRKCDKLIDVSNSSLNEIDFDSTQWKNHVTNGFYCKGINKDILILYVKDNKVKLRFLDLEIDFTDEQPQLICGKLISDENFWYLIINSESSTYSFTYTPYVYDLHDDEGEFDVNFGLWLIHLQKNNNKLNRFINANM